MCSDRQEQDLTPLAGQPSGYSFRPAKASDGVNVAELVNDAYRHYVARIGSLPRPMTDDYAEVIRKARVTIAEHHGAVVGVLVLRAGDEGLLIDNVAVHPSHRGLGLGRTLLELADAEAQRAGFDWVYLYTHERMTENVAFYSRLGYVEYDRRSQGDFSLVYMRKPALAAPDPAAQGGEAHRHADQSHQGDGQ